MFSKMPLSESLTVSQQSGTCCCSFLQPLRKSLRRKNSDSGRPADGRGMAAHRSGILLLTPMYTHRSQGPFIHRSPCTVSSFVKSFPLKLFFSLKLKKIFFSESGFTQITPWEKTGLGKVEAEFIPTLQKHFFRNSEANLKCIGCFV